MRTLTDLLAGVEPCERVALDAGGGSLERTRLWGVAMHDIAARLEALKNAELVLYQAVQLSA